MDLFLLLIIIALLQLVSSQQDNDGNDVDNDQDLTIQAFGNVITPIKGKNLLNLLIVDVIVKVFSKSSFHQNRNYMEERQIQLIK